MTNDERLEIQYKILQLLKNKYYCICEDEEECHEMAKKDSYEIMSIIKEGLNEPI